MQKQITDRISIYHLCRCRPRLRDALSLVPCSIEALQRHATQSHTRVNELQCTRAQTLRTHTQTLINTLTAPCVHAVGSASCRMCVCFGVYCSRIKPHLTAHRMHARMACVYEHNKKGRTCKDASVALSDAPSSSRARHHHRNFLHYNECTWPRLEREPTVTQPAMRMHRLRSCEKKTHTHTHPDTAVVRAGCVCMSISTPSTRFMFVTDGGFG